MHKAKYDDRVEIQHRGSEWVVVHVVTAYWRNETLDIYDEDENGNCRCRNLYYVGYAGYVVAFPGLPYDSYYCGMGIADVEKWSSFKHHDFYCPRTKLTEIEKDKIIALHPNFEYVLKKWPKATISKIMQVLPLWKKYPEIELLLAVGFENVALNKSFYKLQPDNKKKIIKWIQKHPEHKDYTLQQIQIVVKNNLNETQYADYVEFINHISGSCKYEVFAYLKKHNIADSQNLSLYRDYIALVKQTEHSLKELYWKYPSNLEDAHAKVLAEVKIIKEMQKEQKRKLIEEKLEDIATKASKFDTEIDGYDIFVTNNMQVWERQADVLHQCIIHCNYAEKMARGDLILVFIQKKGIPIATAEIKKDLTLGQFYADEHSGTPNGSMPTKEVRDVFQKYFVTLNKKIFSKKRKEKQYA